METLFTKDDLSDPQLFVLAECLKEKSTKNPIEFRRLSIGLLVDLRRTAADKLLTFQEIVSILNVSDNDCAVKLVSTLEGCGYIKRASETAYEVVRHTSHQNSPLRLRYEDVGSHNRIHSAPLHEILDKSKMETGDSPFLALAKKRSTQLSGIWNPHPTVGGRGDKDGVTCCQEEIKDKTAKKQKKVQISAKNTENSIILREKTLDEFLMESIPDASAIAPAISAHAEIVPVKKKVSPHYELYEYYAERYAEVMKGERPSKWSTREYGSCRTLLCRYGMTRVKEIIDRYFKFRPKNAIRDGYPFSAGYSSITFLAGEIDADIKNPERLLEQRSIRKDIDRELKLRDEVHRAFGGTRERQGA